MSSSANTKRDTTIPHFFDDDSRNKDHEVMLDYFLGWTLRCSALSNGDEKLRNASLSVLKRIIPFDSNKYFVKEVRTWKQWGYMDLCAEVVLESEQGEYEKYAILFENKMYTHLRQGQLKGYREKFDSFHKNEMNGKLEYKLRYIFLTCHNLPEKYENDFDEAIRAGFTSLYFGDLREEMEVPTGNFMFDEFWFNYWK